MWKKLFENLPWYVRLPAGACGALMAHFSDQFPKWLEPYAIIGGIGLFAWVAVSFLWHAINYWRVERGKPRIKLEPSHIIILGLAVALGGFIWQTVTHRSSDPPQKMSSIVPQSSDAERLVFLEKTKTEIATRLQRIDILESSIVGTAKDPEVWRNGQLPPRWGEWTQNLDEYAKLLGELSTLSNNATKRNLDLVATPQLERNPYADAHDGANTGRLGSSMVQPDNEEKKFLFRKFMERRINLRSARGGIVGQVDAQIDLVFRAISTRQNGENQQ